jgi:hypothetical protein
MRIFLQLYSPASREEWQRLERAAAAAFALPSQNSVCWSIDWSTDCRLSHYVIVDIAEDSVPDCLIGMHRLLATAEDSYWFCSLLDHWLAWAGLSPCELTVTLQSPGWNPHGESDRLHFELRWDGQRLSERHYPQRLGFVALF